MKFEKLEPGMTVWMIRKHLMGNTTLKTISVYAVNIISVDKDKKQFTYSWNGNSEQKGFESTAAGFKKNKPITIKSPMGYRRLAKREEIKAMKNDQ